MKQLVNISLKHRFLTGLMGFSLIGLTACGGGGGGGGGLPTKLEIAFPLDESAIDAAAADFDIDFLVDKNPDTGTLSVLLNGIDVTTAFTVNVDTDDATARVQSLTAALVDGANTLEATVSGSAKASVTFDYDAEPEIILLDMTGAQVNGAVRHTTLVSASYESLAAESFSFVLSDGDKSFSGAVAVESYPGILRAEEPGVTGAGDMTITVEDGDGDTDVVTLVQPQTLIGSSMAVQVNNNAFPVINAWVGEIVSMLVSDIPVNTFPSPHATATDVSSAYNDRDITPQVEGSEACIFINESRATQRTDCRMFVTDLAFVGNTTVSVNVEDKTLHNITEAGVFVTKFSITFDQVDVRLDMSAYPDGTYTQDAQDGEMIMTMTYNNVSLDILAVTEFQDGKLYQISVYDDPSDDVVIDNVVVDCGTCTASAYTVDFGSFDSFSNISCDVPSCSPDIDLFGLLATAATETLKTTVEEMLDDGAGGGATATIQGLFDDLSVGRTIFSTRIDSPANSDTQISNLKLDLAGSVVEEAKPSSVVGAYIALATSIYADDDGVGSPDLNNVLGSYFDPVAAVEVTSNNLSSTSQVSIALSENMINQLLMGVHQSGAIDGLVVDMTVGDLGTFGTELIAETGGILKSNDPVSVTASFGALPHAEFEAGNVLALHFPEMKLNMVVSFDFVGPDTAEIEMELDLVARSSYDVVNGLPEASVGAEDITAYVKSIVTIDSPVDVVASLGENPEGAIQAILPDFLAGFVQDFTGSFIQTVNLNFDLQCTGLQGMIDVVVEDITLDSENEYILLYAKVLSNLAGLPGASTIGSETPLIRITIDDSDELGNPYYACEGSVGE